MMVGESKEHAKVHSEQGPCASHNRHCEGAPADEAIQSLVSWPMDCFASLAMTNLRRAARHNGSRAPPHLVLQRRNRVHMSLSVANH
jgi:hypothetical protein